MSFLGDPGIRMKQKMTNCIFRDFRFPFYVVFLSANCVIMLYIHQKVFLFLQRSSTKLTVLCLLEIQDVHHRLKINHWTRGIIATIKSYYYLPMSSSTKQVQMIESKVLIIWLSFTKCKVWWELDIQYGCYGSRN
jgi:hypothetical protein